MIIFYETCDQYLNYKNCVQASPLLSLHTNRHMISENRFESYNEFNSGILPAIVS
jgi:hypothetical protein